MNWVSGKDEQSQYLFAIHGIIDTQTSYLLRNFLRTKKVARPIARQVPSARQCPLTGGNAIATSCGTPALDKGNHLTLQR